VTLSSNEQFEDVGLGVAWRPFDIEKGDVFIDQISAFHKSVRGPRQTVPSIGWQECSTVVATLCT